MLGIWPYIPYTPLQNSTVWATFVQQIRFCCSCLAQEYLLLCPNTTATVHFGPFPSTWGQKNIFRLRDITYVETIIIYKEFWILIRNTHEHSVQLVSYYRALMQLKLTSMLKVIVWNMFGTLAEYWWFPRFTSNTSTITGLFRGFNIFLDPGKWLSWELCREMLMVNSADVLEFMLWFQNAVEREASDTRLIEFPWLDDRYWYMPVVFECAYGDGI